MKKVRWHSKNPPPEPSRPEEGITKEYLMAAKKSRFYNNARPDLAWTIRRHAKMTGNTDRLRFRGLNYHLPLLLSIGWRNKRYYDATQALDKGLRSALAELRNINRKFVKQGKTKGSTLNKGTVTGEFEGIKYTPYKLKEYSASKFLEDKGYYVKRTKWYQR